MRFVPSLYGPVLVGLTLVGACTPRVEVAPPKEPITINLNVKIEHEIRVKVEKELEDMFSKESGLF
jgi:hypothetical protein